MARSRVVEVIDSLFLLLVDPVFSAADWQILPLSLSSARQ